MKPCHCVSPLGIALNSNFSLYFCMILHVPPATIQDFTLKFHQGQRP